MAALGREGGREPPKKDNSMEEDPMAAPGRGLVGGKF